jgi:hypothetical protein
MSIKRLDDGSRGYYGQVVIGNRADYLGKARAQPTETHKWCCYLRGFCFVFCIVVISILCPLTKSFTKGVNGLAIPWVSKVVFDLHPSFAQPRRSTF